MATEAEIEDRFKALGGIFLTPAAVIADRFRSVRALLFDWDGVFNVGAKGDSVRSSFSEPDSMGTNMLRYAVWRQDRQMPVCAIVTGEENPTARQFATREHFHEIYSGVRNKAAALRQFQESHGLATDEIAVVFDDINDLAIASQCGIRILVRRDASPLLQDFIAMNSLCDYITAHEAGRYPIREAAELLIGLLGGYAEVVTSRMVFDRDYERFLSERQAIETSLLDTVAT